MNRSAKLGWLAVGLVFLVGITSLGFVFGWRFSLIVSLGAAVIAGVAVFLKAKQTWAKALGFVVFGMGCFWLLGVVFMARKLWF